MSAKLLGVFLVDYLIYNLLGKLIMYISHIEAGAYTSNMILWGKVPFKTIYLSLRSYVADIVFARTEFWNGGYTLVVVGLMIIAFWGIRKKMTEKRYYLYYVLVVMLLLASPFFLPVLMGAAPVARGQLALPFVVAIGIEMIAESFLEKAGRNRTICLGLAVVLLVFIVRNNIVKDNRLFYSDYMVRQQEKALTERIVEKIDEAGGGEGSVVVLLGNWSPAYNPSMLRGETLGWSFYEWDAQNPGGTCKRVLNYWNVLGYRYMLPSEEQIRTAEKIGEKMQSWPQKDSVICEDNLIIVKLSE